MANLDALRRRLDTIDGRTAPPVVHFIYPDMSEDEQAATRRKAAAVPGGRVIRFVYPAPEPGE